MKKPLILAALSVASLTTSLALAQTKAPVDLNGSYSFECGEANFVASLQEFSVQTSQGATTLTTPVNVNVVFPPLPCSPQDITSYMTTAYTRCMETSHFEFQGEDLTGKVCSGATSVVEALLHAAFDRFNGIFTVTVDPGGAANDFFNLYGMDGDITSLDGTTRDGGYLVNRSGAFVGAKVSPGVFTAPGICSLVGGAFTQVAKGNIARATDYALTGNYAGDGSVFCKLPKRADGTSITWRAGLSMKADLSGERMAD